MNRHHTEVNFENYIIKALQQNGWIYDESNSGFDSHTAIYAPDVIAFIKATQSKEYSKLEKLGNSDVKIIEAIGRALRNDYAFNVLKKGVQVAGAKHLSLCGLASDDPKNAIAQARQNANIFRVANQVTYGAGGKEIDLVLFINGLAMATIELKTIFTQTINDAIYQYKTCRKPAEKGQKYALLSPKGGAVVHFAMTENDIFMTTKLDGENTRFLPFNDNIEKDGYKTAYFWDYVCLPKHFLRLFTQFVFVKKDGNNETVIFPRFHQFDAVLKMTDDIKQNGTGKPFLCEHSAGSGKTNTIAWLCHSLVRLYDGDSKLFGSVIVVTDRTVVDEQLQKAVLQIEHQKGLIATINREQQNQSKSEQLADALKKGTPIIVVTIDTFPFVLEKILLEKSLKDKKYAVIIDEAHSSQSGQKSRALQVALSLEHSEDLEKLSAEELLQKLQQARIGTGNISQFAFTATPKHATFMLFGRTQDGQTTSDDNLPQSFHKYTMRQAIDEGYILDVLKGYINYRTAYALSERYLKKDGLVDPAAAKRTIARWQNLHPTNVTQKVEFIVKHFHQNVANLLGGHAKAMIVTASRAAAMRYKIAIDRYLQQNPEYSEYRALVAFSGTLSADDIRHDADETMSGIWKNLYNSLQGEYSEKNANATSADVKSAFEGDEFRLMIVANKFQTGFDEPKLCAMYLDKQIGNTVEVVQTLSRLNRTYTGKDTTYVIDFVGDSEHIEECFKMYDEGAKIEEVQDPNIIFEIKRRLDDAHFYDDDDLEAFKAVYFNAKRLLAKDKDSMHPDIFKVLQPIAKDYNDKFKTLQEKLLLLTQAVIDPNDKDAISQNQNAQQIIQDELQILKNFKSDLGQFNRFYNYVSQFIDLNDGELENFSAFGALLARLLDGIVPSKIDLSGLLLTGYKIEKTVTPQTPQEAQPLIGISGEGGGANAKEQEQLSELIKKLSAIFGDVGTPDEQRRYVENIADKVAQDRQTVNEINKNSLEVAMQGKLPDTINNAVIESLNTQNAFSEILLQNDNDKMALMSLIVYESVKQLQIQKNNNTVY